MADRVTVVETGVIALTLPQIPLLQPERASAEVSEIARHYLEAALLDVAGHVAEEAPRNFGTLAQSFQASPATTAGGIELLGLQAATGIVGRVFSSLPYAIVMEAGRRPGAPISRAGIQALGLWVRRKLGLTGRAAQSATYAIAWAIRRRGIAGRHYAERALRRAMPRVDGIIAEMGEALRRALAGEGR